MEPLAGFPAPQGLYDSSNEKDSCGIGLVTQIKGVPSHRTVVDALEILRRLSHRGASGADEKTGDGTGILSQIPHRFFLHALKEKRVSLPDPGNYGVGMVFLPSADEQRKVFEALIESVVREEQCKLLSWRDVPVDSDALGASARDTEPLIRQFFVARNPNDPQKFERRLFTIRRKIENFAAAKMLSGIERFAIPSLSESTIVYKGLLLPDQLPRYYRDLAESDFESAIAMVHSRFSTNTFPTWALAHPYRYLSHNGEINTLKGNLNWMRARQNRLDTDLLPIIADGQSDSACLDNMAEFLVLGGRSLPHAMMMLIPEPWVGNPAMDLDRRAFYEYHAAMMEPWDGPAAVLFSDGKIAGATLDRNGLRPCRYLITRDDRAILSSEAGVLPIDPALVVEKGRLQPGKMFLVDTTQGRLITDEELKDTIAGRRPYRSWVTQYRVSLDDLPDSKNVPQPSRDTLVHDQRLFGYTEEELSMVLTPMAIHGEEPVSSMGADTPLAVLSERTPLLFNYFRQLFAQVTNPPIDPIREHLVMSLVTYIGPKANLLDEAPEACRRIKIQQPLLTNSELQKIREIKDSHFASLTLPIFFKARDGAEGLQKSVDELQRKAADAVRSGYRFLILSDRGSDAENVPIPSLLATAAVHQHLINESLRTETGLIVETGEARDVHHFACLIGYGAGAVNPYLAFETLTDMARSGRFPEGIDPATAQGKFIKAVNKGLLKIFSKMGISTVQSYCGAQIFEAVGLGRDLMDRFFTRTPSRIAGIGLDEPAADCLSRYLRSSSTELDGGGDIHFRVGGERHRWTPSAISSLQQATRVLDPARQSDAETHYLRFAEEVNFEGGVPTTLRGLLDFVDQGSPIPLEEVEAASSIVRRFTTGAMSLGAISTEAHQSLAIAMNRIGAKSNTGEGGEDPRRFSPMANGDSANSAIKQIASARFGVTAHYLVHALELQIKMAQGAKPGEGGQLPGHKVDEHIAWLRYSTPGVQLISPPPHHDIYSIEDLAQLIHDLKCVNPDAQISVKLVAEAGVGTVAAGVVKAGTHKVLISGDSGGTGASPLSSIRYAGLPWELGLAETQQTLVLNGLRDRVRIETDGQLRTGRDVAIAALLGADEFGFATAPLIAQGCIMMRKCHLNSCPVGIATQDPVLREKFAGRPEYVVNYFFFVAEELRGIMARLGFRTLDEMIGRSDRLRMREKLPHRASFLDLTPLLHRPSSAAGIEIRHDPRRRRPQLEPDLLSKRIEKACKPALERGKQVRLSYRIENVNRSACTRLSGMIARKFGRDGLPEERIHVHFTGSAGQSFGAFLVKGVTLRLEGGANDYLGKGLSGGKIAVYPPWSAGFRSSSILIGNTALYGATSGQCYISGAAGERFAVRNSGATAVVEGVGDHGCEYMTRGLVVVLGPTGRNFAAGMSGGVAFALDEDGEFRSRCNSSLVELETLSDSKDEITLLGQIHEHFRNTGSVKASRILDDWKTYRGRFVKVTPTDYKRILKNNEAQAMTSLDPSKGVALV